MTPPGRWVAERVSCEAMFLQGFCGWRRSPCPHHTERTLLGWRLRHVGDLFICLLSSTPTKPKLYVVNTCCLRTVETLEHKPIKYV